MPDAKRTRRREVVKAGRFILGVVEWHEPTIGVHPFHVTIRTHAGPQYLGVTATLTEARRAVRDNT